MIVLRNLVLATAMHGGFHPAVAAGAERVQNSPAHGPRARTDAARYSLAKDERTRSISRTFPACTAAASSLKPVA